MKEPDTMLSLLLPAEFGTQLYLSEDKAKEFFLFVCIAINVSFISLENFKLGRGFSVLQDQQEVFFYTWMS